MSGDLYTKITPRAFLLEKNFSYLCIAKVLNLVESSFVNAVKSAVLNFMDGWLAYYPPPKLPTIRYGIQRNIIIMLMYWLLIFIESGNFELER